MLKKIIYSALTLLLLFFSSALFSQSYKGMIGEILPKQLFIEKFLQANPVLPDIANSKEANKRFNYKKMPADNMICVSPGKGFTNQIKVYDTVIVASYPSVNIPNAISAIESIR
jgi:hypothetical protein